MDSLELQVEALIFATQKVISLDDILMAIQETFSDEQVTRSNIEECIGHIVSKYDNENFGFHVKEVSNGFLFMTKPEYHSLISKHLKRLTNKRLSKASLETLSIVAYKQPITRPEIEQLRGVNSLYTLEKLLDNGLINILGRDEGPGRPLIYETSDKFLIYFGIKSIQDLPQLKEIKDMDENHVGQPE